MNVACRNRWSEWTFHFIKWWGGHTFLYINFTLVLHTFLCNVMKIWNIPICWDYWSVHSSQLSKQYGQMTRPCVGTLVLPPEKMCVFRGVCAKWTIQWSVRIVPYVTVLLWCIWCTIWWSNFSFPIICVL